MGKGKARLISDSAVKLVIDTDCLCSFLWIRRTDILLLLFKDRIYIPQVVADEISFLKHGSYKYVYQDLEEHVRKGNFKLIDFAVGGQAFREYSGLIKMGRGKGEAAAIAIAKTMDNFTACNNLRDIQSFITSGEIQNVVTYDILYHKSP